MEKVTNIEEQKKLAGETAFAQALNVIHHAYVDMCGDLIAGALLGQILYWFGAGKDGKSRARIVKDGFLWIAKARADWWDEIRITPKQYDRAAKILKDKGFIEVKTYKFAGNPTTHLRIVPEAIAAALDAWKLERVSSMFPDGEEPTAASFSPFDNKEMPQTVSTLLPKEAEQPASLVNKSVTETGTTLTENLKETNQENTAEQTHTLPAAPVEGVPAALAAHRSTVEQINKGFEEAWAEYPRKEGKTKARRAYEKAVRGMGTRKPNGEPYTAAEILAEVVLYKQHIERRVECGDLERRYIPTGGAWFDREGWADEVPSISSTFDDMLDGMMYNKNAGDLRRVAAMVERAPEPERPTLWDKLRRIRAALPY